MCTNVLTYLQWRCKAYPVGPVTVRIVELELEERSTELAVIVKMDIRGINELNRRNPMHVSRCQ